ncbi:ABC transporter permease [Elioraea sp.]|uniref:ABC transporter permease n=1 Tax=Elioraea sp. TaxID=2185103 RepID=UPI0025BD298C|nr:ABC transporter permease [Elioraea sp.]
MLRYAVRRIAASVPVLLLVTLISFSMMHLVPGDPAAAIAGAGATNAEIEAIRLQLGLDKPFLVQLATWYGGLLQGDLGRSILLNRPVWQAIVERLPITLPLALFALLLTLLIGIPAGIIAALRANTWIDQAVTGLAMLGVSVPSFWLALMLIVLFGVHLEWLPTGGFVPFSENPVAWARSMVLPSISLALLQIGLLARITRGTMLEVLRQDYVRTARAKGLPGWMVIGKHALKNVMVPVVTVIGISFGLLLSGSIVIETVYGMPGIGRLIANAIFGRDYPVIQGGLLLTGTVLVLLNLVVDLLYAVIDPRVRYGS